MGGFDLTAPGLAMVPLNGIEGEEFQISSGVDLVDQVLRESVAGGVGAVVIAEDDRANQKHSGAIRRGFGETGHDGKLEDCGK